MTPTDTEDTAKNPLCYLLKLPTELQLDIYELVVIEDRPLLINCPCNSSYSYGRGYKAQREDEEKWTKGELKPPQQPALSRTCRFIRQLTLPIFYQENVFRASYCEALVSDKGLLEPIQWLRMIGPTNREMLRHFYFYDRNPSQDWKERPLKELKECEIFTEMGGNIEKLSSRYCCAHLVTFGRHERKAGEIPLASVPEVPRLKIDGEK